MFYLGFIRPSCRHLCLSALTATVALHVDAQHSAGHPFSNRDRLSPIPEPRAQDDEFERFGTASETPMRPVSGRISVALLKHHVPGKARREFVRAGDETRKGHLDAAIQHLKKAIEIDPAYVEAQNNLGAGYIELGDHEQAIPHLRTASRLDPTSIFARTNLGIALWFGGHGGEAEQVAPIPGLSSRAIPAGIDPQCQGFAGGAPTPGKVRHGNSGSQAAGCWNIAETGS
jgi:hypothetical protein